MLNAVVPKAIKVAVKSRAALIGLPMQEAVEVALKAWLRGEPILLDRVPSANITLQNPAQLDATGGNISESVPREWLEPLRGLAGRMDEQSREDFARHLRSLAALLASRAHDQDDEHPNPGRSSGAQGLVEGRNATTGNLGDVPKSPRTDRPGKKPRAR